MKNHIKVLFVWIMSFTLLIGQLSAASINPGNPNNPAPATGTPDKVSIKAALNEFKHLSKHERKLRIKEAKKELKAYKLERKNGGEPSTNKVLLIVLAILLPPLAVYLHQGEINSKFWISLVLTLLFWIPGVIYALLVVTGEID
jgi:uncharacterized membrane protein YqaE (UPF0057 family)